VPVGGGAAVGGDGGVGGGVLEGEGGCEFAVYGAGEGYAVLYVRLLCGMRGLDLPCCSWSLRE
jgi:hypothetical protein